MFLKQKNDTIKNYIRNNKLQLESIINDYSNYINYIIKNNAHFNFSSEDIEEICSDVFFAIWNNQSKIKSDYKLSNYIYGITQNLMKKKCRNINLNYNIDEFTNILSSSNIDIDSFCITNERMHIILNEIFKMKEEDKNIFTMYYYENQKSKEIAQILNISESKVKIKLFRIRRNLKKILVKKGFNYYE